MPRTVMGAMISGLIGKGSRKIGMPRGVKAPWLAKAWLDESTRKCWSPHPKRWVSLVRESPRKCPDHSGLGIVFG